MSLRDTFLNMLGAGNEETRIKQKNTVFKDARDFLRNGNRDRLTPTWSDIQMSDRDMYRGYSYAVIQKRSNKVATLAKNNLKTWANQDIVDEFQKKGEDVMHPYLKLIADSTDFTEKQFWKSISIYMDLAGRYYLGVIRNRIQPLNPNLPPITTDPTKFIMLNPYEIRRVVDKNGIVAGYIERKKDGRYREWPLHQIIEMRELNPFDPENSQWAMTDAAKNAVYTINQSGDYTRQSLNGNIEAPGIITTDVLLDDEDFANFRARITQHVKGEPLFGNGTGAINWNAMQIDLDKAALMDINEINRTELFAVSGTSKTSLGIEQSGTTRETARVQSEQFISDTAQPRLEDIVDFLNLDYKKYYTREYKTTGYYIEVESAVGRDYDTEQKATELKTSQFGLAMQLIQSGYTEQSAYQFAEGKIDFEDLELEKGLDKPKNPENPEEGEASPENSPNSPNNDPQSGSGSGDDNNPTSEQNSLETANNEVLGDSISTTDLNELTPHSELIENGGKGSGNFGHAGREGEVGGSASSNTKSGKVAHKKYSSDGKNIIAEWDEIEHPIYQGDYILKSDTQIGMVSDTRDNFGIAARAYDVRDKKLKDPFEVFEPINEAEKKLVRDYIKKSFKIDDTELDRLLDNTKNKNSVEGENSHPLHNHEGCTCNHDNKLEHFINEVQEDEGKVVKNEYDKFLQEIREIEKETVDACARKVDINAFEESDIIGERKRKTLTEKIKNALHRYWWVIFPLFANNSMNKRNEEFDEDIQFIFNNDLQAGVDDNAERVAKGHMETILNDILEVSNRAYTNVREEAAADLIVEEYKKNPSKFESYFEEEPTRADALKSIRRTDILEVNRKIYEKANKMAFEGYNRRDIIKAIRKEYSHISETRAELIARNETSRAFTHSQYEADKQFLNGIGKMDEAYKRLVSSRPFTEQDKICPVCQALIDLGPVPFEQPFLKYGESIEVQNGDKVQIFTANYESIEGGTVHPNCLCRYELVFKNSSGEFVKTLNGGKGSGNFGHLGRPGEIGGSGKGEQFVKKDSSDYTILERYVRGDGMDMNRVLRGEIESDFLYEEQIKLMKKATDRELGEEKEVWRSVDASSIFGNIDEITWEKIEGQIVYSNETPEAQSILKGLRDKTLTEKGFMSTTTDKNVAMDWQDFTGASHPVVLHMILPKTAKGIDIAKNTDLEVKDNPQSEIVLKAGTKYKIKDFKNEDGQILVEAEFVENSFEDNELKLLNGGKGSGNFGHAGRPGEIGGSAPTDMSVAVSEQRVNAKWLDEHRAFLRSQGYTDSWIDEQIRTVERQELKKKALKAKTVDQFDKIVDEMKAKGHYSDIWWDTIGKATRSQIEAAIERKSKAVTPDQQETIDDLLSDTGIYMKAGDEKWLRENVPQEMVEHLHNELNKAFELGLSRNLRVQFTTAQQKQGSCTVEGPDYETVLIRLTKNMMSNPEATLLKTNNKGRDGTRWWTCEKGQVQHTITHELGHALVWQALKNQGQNVYQYNSLNSKIVYNAKKAYAGLKDDDTLYDYSSVSKKSQIKLDELRRNEGYKLLSQYGGTNAAETIAESYSNPNYSGFTKEVYNQLIKALKG